MSFELSGRTGRGRSAPSLPLLTLATGVVLVLLAGCASGPETGPVISEQAFFPAPPDPPRIQFVRSFNGSPDFAERNRFLDYLAGAERSSVYEITKAFAVATWKGRLYVTDSFGLQGLNVFDLEQRRFYVLGKTPGGGLLKKPISVFVDDRGYKFVSDLVRSQVVVFDPDDTYLRSYGDGRSFLPIACVAHGDEVFVLDAKKDRVTAADLDPRAPPPEEDEWDEIRRDQILVLDRESGRPLRRIGRHGTGEDGFSFASFLAVDRLGSLYISDFMNHRVVKLDRDGAVRAEFGRAGDRAGDFAHIKGIAVDRRGMTYVVDAAFQAVQVFDNRGTPLFAFGGPSAPLGEMDLPAGIWIDYHNVERFRDLYHPDFEPEYLVIVANQVSTKHRVAVYAYGRRRGVEYPAENDIATLDSDAARELWSLPLFAPDATPRDVYGSRPTEASGPSQKR